MSTVKANNYYDASGGSTAKLYGVSMRDGGTGWVNRIINGDMRIDQRNAGASGSGSGRYFVDRWFIGTDISTIATQRSTDAPSGFTNSSLVSITTGGTVSAGTAAYIRHKIEGFNTADLAWGSASAQSVTLSFWAKASVTGTYGVGLMNSAGNRSYVGQYTISAASTWEYKTIVVPGDTTGTWLTDNGTGVQISFDIGSGSNVQATAGAWSAGSYWRASGNVQLAATTGATFYITGVQLEAGSVASPFERRDYGRELIMCQRYTYAWNAADGGGAFAKIGLGFFSSSTNFKCLTYFPVQMRAAPTSVTASGSLNMFDGASNYTATAVGIDQACPLTIMYDITCSGATAYRPGVFQANNNNTAKLIVSAEL
jgi:hypothetical protein